MKRWVGLGVIADNLISQQGSSILLGPGSVVAEIAPAGLSPPVLTTERRRGILNLLVG
jgi:hypothetical protein